MIDLNKSSVLYDTVANRISLTTKVLKENCGFNHDEIKMLINLGYIRRCGIWKYEFCAAVELCKYGFSFLDELDRAANYFTVAYEIDEANPNVVFSNFLFCLKSKNYDQALKLYDILMSIDKDHSTKYNFFLFLMSYITQLPEEYKGVIQDFKLFVKSFQDYKDLEKTDAFSRKSFGVELDNIMSFFKTLIDDAVPEAYFVAHSLFLNAKQVQSRNVINHIERRKSYVKLLKEKNYDALISLLYERQNAELIDSNEERLLTVVKAIKRMMTINKIPNVIPGESSSISSAIAHGVYHRALYICQEYNRKNRIKADDNPMFLALTDACKLYNEVHKSLLNEEHENSNYVLFAEKVHQRLLSEKGMVLLDGYGTNKTLWQIFITYDDVIPFVVDDNGSSRLALRYWPSIERYGYGITNILSEGNDAFAEKDYDLCIQKYLCLLNVINEPKSFIYSKIGYAYKEKAKFETNKKLQQYYINQALDYLTVANHLCKKEGRSFNYDEIIESLKKQQNSSTLPSSVTFLWNFDNTKIHNAIIDAQGNIDLACWSLGIEGKDLLLVKLAYATYFYAIGYIEQSDVLIDEVKNSPFMDEYVQNILRQFRDPHQIQIGEIPVNLALIKKE